MPQARHNADAVDEDLSSDDGGAELPTENDETESSLQLKQTIDYQAASPDEVVDQLIAKMGA